MLGGAAGALDRISRLDRGLGFAGGQMGFGCIDQGGDLGGLRVARGILRRFLGAHALRLRRLALGAFRVAQGVLGLARSFALDLFGVAGAQREGVGDFVFQVARQFCRGDFGLQRIAYLGVFRGRFGCCFICCLGRRFRGSFLRSFHRSFHLECFDACEQFTRSALRDAARNCALGQRFERAQRFACVLDNHRRDTVGIHRTKALRQGRVHQRVGDRLLRYQRKAGGIGFALDRDQLALRLLPSLDPRANLGAQSGQIAKSVGGSAFRGILRSVFDECVIARVEFDQAHYVDRGLVEQGGELGVQGGRARFDLRLMLVGVNPLLGKA